MRFMTRQSPLPAALTTLGAVVLLPLTLSVANAQVTVTSGADGGDSSTGVFDAARGTSFFLREA